MNSERLRGLALVGVLGAALGGCIDEQLPEGDLFGEVVVPGDVLADSRALGAVFVGVFAGFNADQLGYPYPTTGPRVGDQPLGDTQPYGGTSIGEYAYGCFRALQCDLLTGRFETIDDVIALHPVEDDRGDPIDAEGFYDQCQWYYGWNDIEEFSFLGAEDLDFTQDAEGDWVASWRAWNTQRPAGAILWAFADNDRTSCSIDQGAVNRKRSEDGAFFYEGSNFPDVLNFPDRYITSGDLLATEPVTIEEGRDEGYRVVLDWVAE
jgi:hypothetical protein